MPQFFFHTSGAIRHRDDEGIELRDGEAARAQALISTGELLKENPVHNEGRLEIEVDVTDSADRPVYKVRVVAEVA